MIQIILSALTAVFTYAADSNLNFDQALKISKEAKFTVIRNGKVSEENIEQMEAASPYCAIENLKLKTIRFKKGQKIGASVAKMTFPNKDIKRYVLANAKGYAVFCDFSGATNFDESKVVSQINQQLVPLMKLNE